MGSPRQQRNAWEEWEDNFSMGWHGLSWSCESPAMQPAAKNGLKRNRPWSSHRVPSLYYFCLQQIYSSCRKLQFFTYQIFRAWRGLVWVPRPFDSDILLYVSGEMAFSCFVSQLLPGIFSALHQIHQPNQSWCGYKVLSLGVIQERAELCVWKLKGKINGLKPTIS